MRAVITIAMSVFAFTCVLAQTKSKTNTQPTKPSKAFTIKYLNEKLNQNCSGLSQKKEENFYGNNGIPNISDQTVSNNQGYSITERDGVAYLSCKKLLQNKRVSFIDHSDDYDRTSEVFIEIPVNKISDITFADVPAKTEGKGDVITTYKERLMLIITKDNDVLVKDLEKGNQQYISGMVFPSFNLQDEDKMKRAFLNLKSYYKEEVDPFAQSEVTKKQEDKISFAQEIQQYDKVKLKSWILNTLNENSISAYSLSTTRSYAVNANHRFEIKNDILFYYSEDSLREYNGWKATTEFRSIFHILEVTIPLKDIDIGELNLGGNARGEGIDFYKDVNTFYGTHGDDVTFLTMIAKGLKNSFNVRVTEFKNGNKIEGMPKDIPAQMQYIPINLSKEKVENLKFAFDKLQTEL